MSAENGHKKMPHGVNIPAEMKSPNMEEMIMEMWVDMKMVKVKMYGDKDKKITGVVDELENLHSGINNMNATIKPLIDEREFAKKIGKIIIAACSIFGLGKLANSVLEHWLSKH